MQNQSWRERISHWSPVFFAASLSAVTLPVMIWERDTGSLVAFISFFPMCFYFNAALIGKLRRQVDELQRRLDERNSQAIVPT